MPIGEVFLSVAGFLVASWIARRAAIGYCSAIIKTVFEEAEIEIRALSYCKSKSEIDEETKRITQRMKRLRAWADKSVALEARIMGAGRLEDFGEFESKDNEA